MKRARKVSNVHGEVHFKQKQKLAIAFSGNILLHRKQSRNGADNFIADKIAYHQHGTLSKLNSLTTPPKNFNNSCNK